VEISAGGVLDWFVCEPVRRSSLDHRAPSWSWASVDGSIRTTGVSLYDVPMISIKKIQVAHSPLGYTGRRTPSWSYIPPQDIEDGCCRYFSNCVRGYLRYCFGGLRRHALPCPKVQTNRFKANASWISSHGVMSTTASRYIS
jgi:hypothetical protein